MHTDLPLLLNRCLKLLFLTAVVENDGLCWNCNLIHFNTPIRLPGLVSPHPDFAVEKISVYSTAAITTPSS